MTKIVHPYGYRVGITRDWKSRWFAVGKKDYSDLVRSDELIRGFLTKRLRHSYVSDIQIERGRKATNIFIRTSRPGMIIGRNGEEMNKLKKALSRYMIRNHIAIPEDFRIDVVSVDDPDSNAMIVANSIAEALLKRMPFRRVMKQTIEKVMTVRGVQGVRIVLAGRLGGAEMARKEEAKKGRMALQTLRSDIDYAALPAVMSYGVIGIKVWIYKGDVATKSAKHD